MVMRTCYSVTFYVHCLPRYSERCFISNCRYVCVIIPIWGFTYLSPAFQNSDHHLENLLGFRTAAIWFYILKRSYSTLNRTAYFLRRSIPTRYSRIPNLLVLVSFLHTAAVLLSVVLHLSTTSGDRLRRIGFIRRSLCENQYNTEQYNDKIVTKLRCAKSLFVQEIWVCIILKVDATVVLNAHIMKDARGRYWSV